MRLQVIVVVLLTLTASAFAQTPPVALAVGSKAPDFTLQDTSGKVFKLSECLAKQVTVLEFGRFTAPACCTALTDLQRLPARYAGQGVGIYAVNLDGPGARHTAAASARQLGVQFPVLLDTHLNVARAYGVSAVPQVVVIDAAGLVRFVHAGYDADLQAKLVEMIDKCRKLPRLVVIQGEQCVNCGPMPAILKELQAAVAGKLVVELHAYSADLVEEYKLDWTPALLFFDADGNEVLRHEGPMTRDDLIEQLQKMGVALEAAK